MATKMKTEEKGGIQPIDHQLIKGKIKHVLVTIPALDERWVQDRKFAFYVFPPTKLQNGSYIPGAKETWMSSMSCVVDDIWWLCELPYNKFWSQVIYNKNSMNGIKSFLHLAPLEKLYYKTKDNDILSTYKRVKKAVFQFLKRISRPKESELHFLSDSKYREIMSEYELIPISLVFCICSVYGKKYREDVYTIVSQTVKWNSNLQFERAVLRTIQLFNHLNKKLRASYRELKRNLLCSENDKDVTGAANAYRNCLLATLQFLANATLNISNFLSIYEEGCQVFLNHDFDFHLIRVYEKLLIPLAQEIYILFQDCHQTQTSSWLYSLIDLTRLELMKTFEICLSTTLNNMSDMRITQDFIQRHIKLMKNALKTDEFLQDLNSYCNVVDIVDKIRRKCPGNLDLSDVDRITETVKEFLSKNGSDSPTEKRKSPDVDGELVQWNEIIDYVKEYYDSDDNLCSGSENVYINGADGMFSDDLLSDDSNWSDDANSNSEYESYLAASDEEQDDSVLPLKVSSSNNKTVPSKEDDINSKFGDLSLQSASTSSNYTPDMTLSQVQLQSAIAHVKDILPHLGDGFVAMCLEYYKMDPSAVINAVLEETLPPYLKSLDFSLAQVSADVQQKIDSTLQNPVICDGKNKLRELKKVEYSSYTEMLNDKKEIRDAKNVYESYRNVEEDVLYDDDFDEEIDEVPVAALEVDPEGFYTEYAKVPLQNYNRPKKEQLKSQVSDDEAEEYEEVQPPSNGPKPLDFCENPEITRARREHQRQVTLNRKYPRNNNNRNNRKDSYHENNADERHDKSAQRKGSFENRERPDRVSSSQNGNRYENRERRDKFASPLKHSSDHQKRNAHEYPDRREGSGQNRDSYERGERRDNKFSSQNRNSYENHERQNQPHSQSRNSYENRERHDQPSAQSRNSYDNRERNDQSSWQSRNSYENRERHDQPYSQNRSSYEHREKQEQPSQNRSFQNRVKQDQHSTPDRGYSNREKHEQPPSQSRSFQNRVQQDPQQNRNSFENRENYEQSSSYNEQRDQHSSQSRNSYSNREKHQQPSSQSRSFQNRINQDPQQNSNSFENRQNYEQSCSSTRSYENHDQQDQHPSQSRNSYSNREKHEQPSSQRFQNRAKQDPQQNRNSFENRDYEQSCSYNRSYENHDQQDQHFSQSRNSYENREKREQPSSQSRNSYENRSWRNNNSGESTNNERERHLKNVHKARQANHSRKFFSDKKRNY